MGVLEILAAAAAGFAAGFLWIRGFGRRWLDAVGLTRESYRDTANPVMPVILGIVACLATAAMLGHVLAASGVEGIWPSLVAGLGSGAFLVAPILLVTHAMARRPRTLALIDAGLAVVVSGVIGTVLGLIG